MLFQVPEVGHMSLSLEEWGTEMYGASHLTAHEWHLHAFMGIYKHVSSMLGNFTSHYFFKKSLLNSFTFPSTVPKALSQQNNAFFCVLQCVWHGDRSVAKAIDARDLVVAMDFVSLVFRARRHSQHLQGAIPWLQNSGQNWKCEMIITVWMGDSSFAFLLLDSRDFCAVLSTLTEPRKHTLHSGWRG